MSAPTTPDDIRNTPQYKEAVAICQAIYDEWSKHEDGSRPLIHEAKGHIARVLIERDKGAGKLTDALQEIMAYTDPVEDRAYVIAEAALAALNSLKETNP